MAAKVGPEGKWVSAVTVQLRAADRDRLLAVVGEGGNVSAWCRPFILAALDAAEAAEAEAQKQTVSPTA